MEDEKEKILKKEVSDLSSLLKRKKEEISELKALLQLRKDELEEYRRSKDSYRRKQQPVRSSPSPKEKNTIPPLLSLTTKKK